jgi:hypothetical protein
MTAPQPDPNADPSKSDDPDSQQEPPQQDDQQQQDGSGSSDQDSGDGQDSGSSGPSLEAQLEAEKRKNLKLTKDLGRAEADKKKADEDKDAAKERDEARTENTKLKGLLETKFLVWSIETNKKYDWIDVDDVMKCIKPDEINIDIDADEIQGLDMALKRIAKDKPHFLKKADDDEQRPPSGSHPIGSRPGDTVTEQKRLGAKYKIPGFGTQAQKFM